MDNDRIVTRGLDHQEQHGLDRAAAVEMQQQVDDVFARCAGRPVDEVRRVLDDELARVSIRMREQWAEQISAGERIHLVGR